MGNCGSSHQRVSSQEHGAVVGFDEDAEAERRSRALDKEIREYQKRLASEVKILLLGEWEGEALLFCCTLDLADDNPFSRRGRVRQDNHPEGKSLTSSHAFRERNSQSFETSTGTDSYHTASHSNFLQQMKVIHGIGFADFEVEHYRQQVFMNLWDAMRACLEAMQELNMRLSEEANRVSPGWTLCLASF